MIRQYLSNTNEIGTIYILELNKALWAWWNPSTHQLGSISHLARPTPRPQAATQQEGGARCPVAAVRTLHGTAPPSTAAPPPIGSKGNARNATVSSYGSSRREREMGDHEGRGDDFEKKADQKLSGWGLFGNKYEEAADLLDRAGNFFKLAKNCETPCPPFCIVRQSRIRVPVLRHQCAIDRM